MSILFKEASPMLKSHGRYDFSPIVARQQYSWKGGARIAMFFAVNVEQFPFGEGVGPELNPRQPPPDVLNYSYYDWGNRVGVWRLLELFDEYQIPATAFLNTAIYDHCPEVAAAFRARGDEFVGHGRTNAERQSAMDPDTELTLLREVYDRIGREEGTPPRGWMGPWVSESFVTPDLLYESGYRYTMDWMFDDQPIWMNVRTEGGRLLAIPYARPTSDMPMLHGSKHSASQWADALIDQIDEMVLQANRQPLVFNLSLHPYLMHAFRLRQLRRVLTHISQLQSQIWLTRPGEIFDHISGLGAGTGS
jgi:peptidoglycan/xylan/chitin deacetylase (PgdA/CDA1 family)